MNDVQPGSAPARSRVRIIAYVVLACVVVALAWRFWPWRGTVSTDDAYIAGRVVSVSATIPGRISTVLVEDNQHVTAGTVLAELDTKPMQARLEAASAAEKLAAATLAATREVCDMTRCQAEASIASAAAGLLEARASLDLAQAQERASQSEAKRAEDEHVRYAGLHSETVTAQQLERVTLAAQGAAADLAGARDKVAVARAALAQAQAKVEAAKAGPHELAAAKAGIARSAADLERAHAEVSEAQLALSYARIVAPFGGWVTHKSVEPGAYVQSGEALMAVVSDDLWVVANFKESQIGELQPGAHATISVDAYHGTTFRAHVDSIQAGSGSAFSLLPPENASGNFVKIIQRVPVKLVFDQQPNPQRYHLGPGMSVEPSVEVH